MVNEIAERLSAFGVRLRQWWRDSAPVTQAEFDDYVRHQADIVRRLWTRIDALEYGAELAGIDGFANKPRLEPPRTVRKWVDIPKVAARKKAEAKARARHKS
jgi:formylglycine-generating enzyme required for sulfatase activity